MNGFPPPGHYPSSHQLPGMPGMPMPQPGGVNVAQAAAQNVWGQLLAAPPRQQVNRARAPDGNHIVRFTADCKMKQSQQDMQWFMAIEYMVVESTVPQAQGQVFSTVMFFKSRPSLEAVADLGKLLFGQQGAMQYQDPMQLGNAICQKLSEGIFSLVNTYRSAKQIAEKGYDNAWVNHRWAAFFPQQVTLAQAMQYAQQIRQQAQGAPQQPPVPQQPVQQQMPPVPQQPQAWPQQPAPQLQAAPQQQQVWQFSPAQPAASPQQPQAAQPAAGQVFIPPGFPQPPF